MNKIITILYKNWKGVENVRKILPFNCGLWFGLTEWHPEEQWFIRALDVEKNEVRDFALKDIKKIE